MACAPLSVVAVPITVAPLRGQLVGDGRADAAAGAGDQGDFTR